MKSKIQSVVVDNLLNKKPYQVLEHCTGLGKSLSALKCIEAIEGKWYIICKERNHIHNWQVEIKKHSMEHLFERVEFFCYASLKKYKNTSPVGVVLDECHAIKSAIRIKQFNTITPKYALALSATIDDEIKDALKSVGFVHKRTIWNKISLYEAIGLGILPKPIIYVKYTYLDNRERDLIYEFKKGRKVSADNTHICTYEQRFSKLSKLRKTGENYLLNVLCNEQEYYNIITEQLKYYQVRQSMSEYFKFKFLNLGSTRKRFLASTKTTNLKKLLDITKGKRRVIFTGSIDQCIEIGDDTGIIHSKLSMKDVQERIIDFNRKKIATLYSVYMIRESANLTDIEVGIMTQLDSKKLSFTQVLGRLLRGENPVIYVMCVKNTQDEKYLQPILDSPLSKYINILR